MKYQYNKELECFERIDKKGKKLWINSVEGQRIVTLSELGNLVPEIRNKINFSSRKVSESSIDSFLKLYHKGDITLPDDVGVPVDVSLTVEERIQSLEDRVSELEDIVYREPVTDGADVTDGAEVSWTDKVRGLFNYG